MDQTVLFLKVTPTTQTGTIFSYFSATLAKKFRTVTEKTAKISQVFTKT